jgi:hypothetical protein
VLALVGISRECNLVGKNRNSHANPGQEWVGSSGDIGVRGRPLQQKSRRTGSSRGGTHERYRSQMVLGIWVGTCFQEELNKVEVGHVARVACMMQWRSALWDRYSVEVGAVFNKLFCKDELDFTGRILDRIGQIGQ